MQKPPIETYVFEPFKVTKVQPRGPEIPRPRSGHRIVCDDNRIYCFGGYNPSLPLFSINRNSDSWSPERPLFKELWSFSISRKKWKEHKVVENMPNELASNAMCMHGNYLMIYGGTGAPFGDKCNNDLLTWKTSRGDAKFEIAKVEGVPPPGLYGQAILCHNGYFYTIGGTDGFGYNCDVHRLDLRTLQWEPVFVGTGQEEEPFGRYRHEVARVGNKIYILGGGTREWAFELMEIPCFDIATKKWSTLIPKPEEIIPGLLGPLPRKCHSAVQVSTSTGEQIFVTGGSDGQTVFEDVWRLDVASLTWTMMQKTLLPVALYFHDAAVTSHGCMYLFGGIEAKEDSIARNNALYKVWLCVPRLSEMCWEALLHYHPELDTKDKRKLVEVGVPMRYVERLAE